MLGLNANKFTDVRLVITPTDSSSEINFFFNFIKLSSKNFLCITVNANQLKFPHKVIKHLAVQRLLYFQIFELNSFISPKKLSFKLLKSLLSTACY